MNSIQLGNFLESTAALFYISVTLCIITAIIAVITIINIAAIKKLKGDYSAFMLKKAENGRSIEELLNECLHETKEAISRTGHLSKRVLELEERLPHCFSRIGVVRYNPFDDMGGDLSYAVALLDETNTGIVFNGIHNRAGSYTYAKSVVNGEADKHKLSEEEMEAVKIAVTTIRRNV